MAESEFAGEDPAMTAKVIQDLKDGWGVEDMKVRGTCTADYARKVVKRLRKDGMLKRCMGLTE